MNIKRAATATAATMGGATFVASIVAQTWITPPPSVTQSKPNNECVAELRVFEDGSWVGERLLWTTHNPTTVLDKHWSEGGHMKKWGWRPYAHNVECKLVFVNDFDK
jgi:hypothetical protein